MKKKFLAATLILVVMVAFAWADSDEKNTINYKKVEEFVDVYYDDFNLHGQDPETIDMMDKYWAPEFVAVAYFPTPQYPTMDLAAWKHFILSTHVDLLEILTCKHLSVDTKKLTFTSLFKMELFDRHTGAEILTMDTLALYTFKVGKQNDIKITSIKLFVPDPYTLMAIFFPDMVPQQ